MDETHPTRVPTSVYRYYDKSGLLLYVGITSRGSKRNHEHNSKQWWEYVVRQEVEHHPSRPAAEARERDLIRKFRPPFNTVHNPDAAKSREAYLAALVVGGLSVEKLVTPLIPAGRRITLDVVRSGAIAVLKSRAADARIINALDLEMSKDLTLATGGRRGTVELMSRSGGVLQVRIKCNDLPKARHALLMFRMPQANKSTLTIKRIDIVEAAA